jgi:putative FmdB family regulatory protein
LTQEGYGPTDSFRGEKLPLYDYVCISNKHEFELRESVHDEPATECPTCGGPVRRVIHPVGIVFKGSGFYTTDSRKPIALSKTSSSKASEDGASREGKSDAKGEGETKSEKKSDAPSGPKDDSKRDSKGESKKESAAS